MARGDHLRASRAGYHHDGIDLGNGTVVHFAADPGGSKATAVIRHSTYEDFASGGQVTVRPYAGDYDPEVTVARAVSRVGQSGYDLMVSNCEHFARCCVTGDHHSEQVVVGVSAAAALGLPWLAGTVGLSFVASSGVAGVSGAGVMSGLAAAGTVVGGGVLAGTAVLGTVPALVGAVIVHRFSLADDIDLPDCERRARTAGRVGAIAGGIGALGVSTWAIGALGVPGVSAAGISSGFAALGSIVGGGMASGVGFAIATPIIGVAAGAYLFYRLWLWLEQWQARQASAARSRPAAT